MNFNHNQCKNKAVYLRLEKFIYLFIYIPEQDFIIEIKKKQRKQQLKRILNFKVCKN